MSFTYNPRVCKVSENGKGDKQRPLSVDKETFNNNWERIFSSKSTEYECEYSGLPSVSAYKESQKQTDPTLYE